MDPQANNDAEALKQRLNPTPLSRPATPDSGLEDIDDSAFAIGADTPQPVAQPVVPIKPLQPVRTIEPVAPRVEPIPPPPAPVAPPRTLAPPPPPPLRPQPAPATPPPPQAMPPASPPPVPQLMTPAPVPEPAPLPPRPAPVPIPRPVAPPQPAPLAQPVRAPVPAPMPSLPPKVTPATLSPRPTAAAFSPPSVAAYQPPSKHVAADIVERIDETPQQNSKDIEALIEHNHNVHRLKSFASFLVFVAGVIIAAFLINTYVFQSYYVDGTSMTPTLQNDDRLIIDKVERTVAGVQGKPYIPQRGQIVVLDSSIVGINGRDEQLIKRVIGLPGDTIIIKDGAVTIKNTENPDGFDVNAKLGLKLQPTYVESPLELTIPDGQVFVMGDNRVENGSYDSRAFGPIEAKKIVGRLWARILPLDKAQVF